MNLYGYTNNDPVNFNDPEGLRGARLARLAANTLLCGAGLMEDLGWAAGAAAL
jgi:hypothetical protein